MKRAALALGATSATLTLVEREGEESATSSRSVGFEGAEAGLLRVRYSLLRERPDEGAIELGWTDGRAAVDRDTEIGVELLCEHVLSALQRLQSSGDGEGAGKVVPLRSWRASPSVPRRCGS